MEIVPSYCKRPGLFVFPQYFDLFHEAGLCISGESMKVVQCCNEDQGTVENRSNAQVDSLFSDRCASGLVAPGLICWACFCVTSPAGD